MRPHRRSRPHLPEYETATGPHGELAELMLVLCRGIWGDDWVGGAEHLLWKLYLEALDGPAEQGDRALVRRFGGLALALDGLWTWPVEADGPAWTPLATFAPRHAAWLERRAEAGAG